MNKKQFISTAVAVFMAFFALAVNAQVPTPDAPTPGAVRRYLREFLGDPRVVEIPRPIWWLIMNAIILSGRVTFFGWHKQTIKAVGVFCSRGHPQQHSGEHSKQYNQLCFLSCLFHLQCHQ